MLKFIFSPEKDIKIKARIAQLESVFGYGTDKFESNASNMFANASYSRFATFTRMAPTVFKAHGDFIADITELYAEHSVQKQVRNEKITAGKIDSTPLKAHETVVEHSSGSGFNIFAPTSVVAPICDGNIHEAIDSFWRQSSLLTSTHALLHSRKGAEIAANGISTALSAYSSIKTILDYGTNGTASLFGIGSFGFYSTEAQRRATHNFTIGSSTVAENNIEWYATTGDIDITHRIAKAGGNQNYTAAGKITVNPGEDTIDTVNRTQSTSCSFNMFTMDLTAGVAGANETSKSTEYQANSFESQGTNVFRAGENIAMVIPQISGTRNVFDAVLVSLENKANEEEMQSEIHGATFSTNLAKTAAGTLGANIGASNSHDTHLNDAYIRGATDFMHSQVKNQGCLVMNIDNAGASYEYVPGHEVHESSSFAIGLSGLDLSSPDGFAYSLGRSLASSAASAGVGMLASQAGLGGFVSTIAASLAGSYVNSEVFPQAGDNKIGLGSNSQVSFEHNGDGFSAIGIEFDKNERNAVINKVKEKVFAEALDAGALTEEAVHKSKEAVEQFTQQVSVEKTKVDETAERIDNAESVLRDEITSAIGDDEVRKLAEGKSISAENRDKVIKSLSKSIQHLERQKAELNLHAPINQNDAQQASLQAQNELINEKIQQYSLLSEFLSRAQSGITRSNSADNLLHDTYIRQGQRAFGTVAGAFSGLAHEADSMSQHDYVELQRSRLPVEAQNNPEVLAKLGAGYALYKGAAKLGHCISALDDATGNMVSETMHKLGEGFDWLGTHTRRFVRDDLGFSQRVAQNTGDIAQIAAEIFGPGTLAKGVGSVSKIVGASKFRSALGERFGLYKGDISAAKIGLNWNGAILGEQSYGMAFENYIATLPEFKRFRLPKNFKTFDFWDRASGHAVSVKTLNTNTAARLVNPNEIYHTLKGYVDRTLEFTVGNRPKIIPLDKTMIRMREIQLAIPADTGIAQMQQIQRAVEYGRLNNVNIIITRIGK